MIMLTGKQKRYLRGLANPLTPLFQIGKEAPSQGFYEMVDKALEAHELIKISLLNNSALSVKEAGEMVANNTKSELVQTIGKVIVLYRPSEERKIILP